MSFGWKLDDSDTLARTCTRQVIVFVIACKCQSVFGMKISVGKVQSMRFKKDEEAVNHIFWQCAEPRLPRMQIFGTKSGYGNW